MARAGLPLRGYGTSSLIEQFQTKEAEARAANIKREQELRGMYETMVERYQPGGAFQKGALAEIETAKTKGMGQEMQQLISSGMYGTTTAAGIPSRWEAEVGTPARLKLEDISMQRLTQAEQAKAGFVERIQEPYPDYGPLMQAVQAASAVGGGGGAGGAPQQSLQDWMEGFRGPSTPSPSGGGFQPPTGGYGQAAQPTTAAQPATAATTQAAVPDFTTPAGYGTVKPTEAEQFTITERLKAMYPQMAKPGWGKVGGPVQPGRRYYSGYGGRGV